MCSLFREYGAQKYDHPSRVLPAMYHNPPKIPKRLQHIQFRRKKGYRAAGGYQELRAVLSSEIPHIRVCQIITCRQRTKSGRMRCFPGSPCQGRPSTAGGHHAPVTIPSSHEKLPHTIDCTHLPGDFDPPGYLFLLFGFPHDQDCRKKRDVPNLHRYHPLLTKIAGIFRKTYGLIGFYSFLMIYTGF